MPKFRIEIERPSPQPGVLVSRETSFDRAVFWAVEVARAAAKEAWDRGEGTVTIRVIRQ
jgi:hypothetical protein